MELLRPSGEHIVTLLAECDAFTGIGMVKARRLWDHFGQDCTPSSTTAT
jgi:exodeoxyribonuclease V alpha subunit